jgi:2-hydroxy-6-oxonona-2,4-dienedioate hydrolase
MFANTIFHKMSLWGWALTALAVLLAGGAILVGLCYSHDLQNAQAQVKAGSQVVTTGCGTIEYAEAGSGTPVLIIHGAGGGYDQGLLLGEMMLGSGYRVIAPSRFGYLGSPIPADSSVEAQADAYICLLDRLGIQKAAVMGVSAGGPSAMQFALRHPERTSALVLVSAVSYTGHLPVKQDPKIQTIDRIMGSDFVYWAGMHTVRGTLLALFGVPTAVQAHMSADDSLFADRLLDAMLPTSTRIAGIQLDQTHLLARDDRLAGIKTPTLVLHARDDALVPLTDGEYSAATIPGAHLVVFADGGHFIVNHMQEVQATIGEFLAGK